MLIRRTLQPNPKRRPPLTLEQIAELEARAPRDDEILYDDDCPEMTDEQLRQFKRVKPYPDDDAPAQKFG